MIIGFRDKALKAFYERGKTKGFPQDLIKRIGSVLAVIDVAQSLDDLKRPALRLHQLEGDRKGQWSVSVNDQWRIVFDYEDGDFDNLEFVDYH